MELNPSDDIEFLSLEITSRSLPYLAIRHVQTLVVNYLSYLD